jgi:cadmium resistance protein CadD (predicted permease)
VESTGKRKPRALALPAGERWQLSSEVMTNIFATLGLATTLFACTNLDDLLVVSAFFAQPEFNWRTVVAGQLLGIGSLRVASALMGLAAVAVPGGTCRVWGLSR